MNRITRLLGVLVLAALTGSCSFTTATGFVECQTDRQCGAANACISNFCIPMPASCRRVEGEFDAPDHIPLMALLPITDGDFTDNSELQGLNALKLAVSEANRASGIRGRLFGLYACNTNSNDQTITQQTQFAVTQLKVPAIISSGSGQTELIANVKERQDAKTMIISPTSTSERLVATYRVDKSVWRVPPSDGSQAKVMTRLINEPGLDAGATFNPAGGIAVLYQEDAYGIAFAQSLLDQLADAGRPSPSLSFGKSLSASAASATANSLSMLNAGSAPKTTVFIGLPQDLTAVVGAVVANQPSLRRSAGHQWLLSDGVKDPVILVGPTRSELINSIGTTPAQASGTNYQFFKGRFQTAFNANPEDYSFIPHGYDAMYLTMLAAAWASQADGGVTGANMSAGMAQLSAVGQTPIAINANTWPEASNKLSAGTAIDLQGTSGELNFDNTTGAPSAPYDVWQATDAGIRVNLQLNP